MNKNFLKIAAATALAAPAGVMAEAVLYGRLHSSIDYADVKNAVSLPVYDDAGNRVESGVDFKGWGVAAGGTYMPGSGRSNRVGVKGSEDLGYGLRAIYQFEMGFELSARRDDNIPGNDTAVTVRNTFVGVAGDFGTALVGRHDTPYKLSTGRLDLFGDTMADQGGTVGFDSLRVDNAIAYISPNFSGFQFMGALVAPGGATAIDGRNSNADDLNSAYSLAGIYSNGPFYGSVAYEVASNDMFMNTGTSRAGRGACFTEVPGGLVPNQSCNYVKDDYTKWRIGLGLLDWNGFTFTAMYEQQDDLPGGQMWSGLTADGRPVYSDTRKQSLWQVQAGYSFGNNMVKAMYGAVDRDSNIPRVWDEVSINNLRKKIEGDRNTWAVAFDHNFSQRTKAYVVYTAVDDDQRNFERGSEWSGFSVGMQHSF